MRRVLPFLVLLAVLSAISGYLMSKASWIGKVGMTFFYREYNFMKVWWQGGLAVFLFLMLLFLLHSFIERKMPFWLAKFLHLLLVLADSGGFYLTYDDFTTDFSHRLLGWRFHYGFYLVWVDWLLICIYFLFKHRKPAKTATVPGKTETTTP